LDVKHLSLTHSISHKHC